MKYFTLIALALIALIPAYSQQPSKYEIFKVVGDVTFTTSGAAAKKGDAAKPTDRMTLAADSRVGILDKSLHRIYYGSGPLTTTVAAVIRNAKRHADNAVASVNSEALATLHNGNNQAATPKVMGVSYRGDAAEDAWLESVALALNEIEHALPNNHIGLETVEDDGTFYFRMSNDTDRLLYVNVVAIAPGHQPRLCLNIGNSANQPYIALAPHSQLTLTDFVFADYGPVEYYMLATDAPVDAQALTVMLNRGQRSDGGKAASIMVSPKICR